MDHVNPSEVKEPRMISNEDQHFIIEHILLKGLHIQK